MTATTTSIRPRKPPRASLMWIVPVVLAVAASVFVLNLAQSVPGRDVITVQNQTGAYVTVNAKGDRGGWLGLGTVDPKSRTEFESVADQGGVWRFRLTVGPDWIGEIVRTRDQLERSGWKITIPPGAADQLRPERRSR
jgi:hypothetical protein